MGAGILGRAVVQAYQQALANSARGGAAAAGGRAARGRISTQEAAEVLGLEESSGLKEIYGKYDKLFNANDAKKGGSIYLQAKIYHAKNALEKEAIARGEKPRLEPEAIPKEQAPPKDGSS